MGQKTFTTTFQPINPVDAKNFLDTLHSEPDISLGDESMYGDPFGEFVYGFLEPLGYDVDLASDGNLEVLDIDDQGVVNGKYVVTFDDGQETNLEFKGFVAQGDGYKLIVITEINW